MQHVIGPNFSDAREKAFARAFSDEMSQARELNLEALIKNGGRTEDQAVTFAPAERRALTVAKPMKPEPPVEVERGLLLFWGQLRLPVVLIRKR